MISLEIHQKVANALGYTEELLKNDDIVKMLQGSGISKLLYKKIIIKELGQYRGIHKNRIPLSPSKLKILIEQVKGQPDGDTITRREAEKRIILLAQKEGRPPYAGNITSKELARYLDVDKSTFNQSLIKVFGYLTEEERSQTNVKT